MAVSLDESSFSSLAILPGIFLAIHGRLLIHFRPASTVLYTPLHVCVLYTLYIMMMSKEKWPPRPVSLSERFLAEFLLEEKQNKDRQRACNVRML